MNSTQLQNTYDALLASQKAAKTTYTALYCAGKESFADEEMRARIEAIEVQIRELYLDIGAMRVEVKRTMTRG